MEEGTLGCILIAEKGYQNWSDECNLLYTHLKESADNGTEQYKNRKRHNQGT